MRSNMNSIESISHEMGQMSFSQPVHTHHARSSGSKGIHLPYTSNPMVPSPAGIPANAGNLRNNTNTNHKLLTGAHSAEHIPSSQSIASVSGQYRTPSTHTGPLHDGRHSVKPQPDRAPLPSMLMQPVPVLPNSAYYPMNSGAGSSHRAWTGSSTSSHSHIPLSHSNSRPHSHSQSNSHSVPPHAAAVHAAVHGQSHSYPPTQRRGHNVRSHGMRHHANHHHAAGQHDHCHMMRNREQMELQRHRTEQERQHREQQRIQKERAKRQQQFAAMQREERRQQDFRHQLVQREIVALRKQKEEDRKRRAGSGRAVSGDGASGSTSSTTTLASKTGPSVLAGDLLKKYRIENESFRLWSYYKPISKKLLGRGGYGVVMEAMDLRNGQKVAIKKMKNVFAHLNTAKCSLRELALMMHFDHRNIIDVVDCMLPEPRNEDIYQQVYYVMPKMQSTLKTVSCFSSIEITANHRCFILYQILCGIRYIHNCDVIHRDLKPENILIDSDCSIKITDFGMARGLGTGGNGDEDREEVVESDEVLLSEYVTTRWYRAPEIMLCSRHYHYSIDVWSIACIHCEMVLRKPVFAGNHHLEQLDLIFDAVGTPNKTECRQWIKSYDALRWVLSLPVKPRKTLNALFQSRGKCKDIGRNEADLISKMFTLNPQKRIATDEALKHKFFKKIPTKSKSVRGSADLDNVAKFDPDRTFERQLTEIASCRRVMTQTLSALHQRARDIKRRKSLRKESK